MTSDQLASVLETYQLGFIMILAALAGAALGYAASIRGRFRIWPVVAAPFVACLVNVGAMVLLARLAPTWPVAAQQSWTQLLTKLLVEIGLVAFGIFLWGAVPAVLGSLLFQVHCRYRSGSLAATVRPEKRA